MPAVEQNSIGILWPSFSQDSRLPRVFDRDLTPWATYLRMLTRNRMPGVFTVNPHREARLRGIFSTCPASLYGLWRARQIVLLGYGPRVDVVSFDEFEQPDDETETNKTGHFEVII